MKGKLLLALCLLLLMSSLSYARFGQTELKASGASLPVHDLNTGLSYATIQDAIDANETLNGDTIRVDAGIYYEHITISRAIRLVGESPESTIIDGNNTGSVIDLGVHSTPPYTNNVSISNFTIRNAGPDATSDVRNVNACVRGGFVQNIDLENNVFLSAGRCVVPAASSLINLSNNDISNSVGPAVDVGAGSTNVTIRDNLIHDFGTVGIQDDGNSINCCFINNTVEKGQYGIYLAPNIGTLLCPANITVNNNLVNECSKFGIVVTGDTRDCNITDNTVQNCPYGIALEMDETALLAPVGNLIDGNILSNDNGTNILYVGSLEIGQNQESYTNVFRGNNMTNFGYHNLMVWGYNLASFMQDIDSSNTVNGKSIYYLTNQSNLELDPSKLPNAGSLALVNCANVTVRDFDFTGNNDGLLLAGSTDCTLTDLTLANNQLYLFNQSNPSIYGGLTLFNSTGNTVLDCRICNNTCGVWLSWSSNSNTFYHNAFVDNDHQVISDIDSPFENVTWWGTASTCTWDNTLEGNYWSDYNGTDLDQDGIGDTSYTIDSNNVDFYPLMGMFNSFNATSQCSVETVSNSTISKFQFNGTAISFNASGDNGTTGFCRIGIPTALINGAFTVFVNGTEIPYTLLPESNSTQSYLYLTIHHSTQEVTIIPEFPSFLILPLMMMATLLAAIIYKKKGVKTSQS